MTFGNHEFTFCVLLLNILYIYYIYRKSGDYIIREKTSAKIKVLTWEVSKCLTTL